jgi:hypothetical protein
VEREKERLEKEKERENVRSFELEKLKLEIEAKERGAEKGRQHTLQLATVQGNNENTNNNHGREIRNNVPKLPTFNQEKDDMVAYLFRFEMYARTQDLEKERWAVHLSALLTGVALDVYSRQSAEKCLDYEYLKNKLLKRCQLNEEGFRAKSKTSRPEKGESANQFRLRLIDYFDHWISMTKIELTYNDLKDLMVKDHVACNRQADS